MKLLLIFSFLIMAPIYASSHFENQFSPVQIEDIYIPAAFSSDDEIEVVITGFVPNFCFEKPQVTIENEADFIVNIYIDSQNTEFDNLLCIEALMPFTEKIKLGKRNFGEHRLYFYSGNELQHRRNLFIEPPSLSFFNDSHLALVKSLNIERVDIVTDIVIEAYIPSACFKVDKLQFIDNGENSYTIFPLLKKKYDFCPSKLIPVTMTGSLPEWIEAKKVLLYAKSSDGKSLYKIIEKK